MTEVAIAEYILCLCVAYFTGVKFGAAVKFIVDLGR
jgi:hypothetical protein